MVITRERRKSRLAGAKLGMIICGQLAFYHFGEPYHRAVRLNTGPSRPSIPKADDAVHLPLGQEEMRAVRELLSGTKPDRSKEEEKSRSWILC